jgi:hypothetical protein
MTCLNLRAAALAVLVLIAPGCSTFLFDDRCGVESRSVTINARIPEADPNLGYVQFNLVENREPFRGSWWVILSDSLNGRIQKARLLGPRGGGARVSLLEIPVFAGVGDAALRGESRPYDLSYPFDDLFVLFQAAAVTLELETDIQGRGVIQAKLSLSRFDDWDRPHCS